MSQPSFTLRPLVLGIALAIGACTSLPALAGVTCQLLDANGNDIGDGGADAGPDNGSGSNDSVACGRNAQASNAQATAFGTESSTNVGGVAIGYRAIASGNFNTAIGHNANAGGQFRSTAIGSSASTSNYYATAIGANSSVSGASSVAAGNHARAAGDYSAAFGGIRVGLSENQTPTTQATRATGFAASAFGSAAHADASESVAFGSGSTTLTGADRAVALGAQAVAGEADTVSLGHAASDLDYLGNAFGSELNRRMTHLAAGIDDTDAVNVGQLNAALADAGSPYVAVADAAADIGTADAQATGWGSIAIGSNAMANTAGGQYGTAIGAGSQAQGYSSVAIGPAATTGASAFGSIAIGLNAVANEAGVVSFGHAAGDSVLLPGSGATITFATEQARRLIHVGAGTGDTDAVNLSQLYPLANVLGGGAGYAGGVFTAPTYIIQGNSYGNVGNAFAAVDASLSSLQANSNGITYDNAAQDSVTLAGASGTRIGNVADGVAATDAANLGQVQDGDAQTLADATAHADAGDAATLASANAHADAGDAAVLTAANDYTDAQVANATGAALDAANDYTDTRETAIRTDMAAGDAATLTAANSYTDGQIANASAVVLDSANAHADAGDAATLTSANSYTDSAAAATLVSANSYTDTTAVATLASANAHADSGDAQTLSDAQDYADTGDAETLTAANAYTDQRFTELTGLSDSFDAYKGEVNDRFNRMDRRIDKMAAMSGAYAGMAMNTAGLAGKNRVGVGIGAQGGEQAMAVGYQRAIGNRASVSLGAAFGGGEKSVSAGAGFSW